MILGNMLGNKCAVWIDDILLYGKKLDEYITNLACMLDHLEEVGFKSSLKKSKPLQTQIKWCGRIIDREGIGHDPARIQALNDLGYPNTAGDLMQFICSSGWMRASIIDYARLAEPLSKK